MTEDLRTRDAFERYYAAGSGRNLVSLADHYGVTERTLKRWSVAFRWQERIAERDAANGQRLQAATDKSVVDVKAEYRQIVRAAIGQFVRTLKAGSVPVQTVPDLERLVKLDLLLLGEATDRHSVIEERLGFDTLTDEELQHELEAARRALAADGVPEEP